VELSETIHHHTTGYDATELCAYHFHAEDHPETLKARAAAKDFSESAPTCLLTGLPPMSSQATEAAKRIILRAVLTGCT